MLQFDYRGAFLNDITRVLHETYTCMYMNTALCYGCIDFNTHRLHARKDTSMQDVLMTVKGSLF